MIAALYVGPWRPEGDQPMPPCSASSPTRAGSIRVWSGKVAGWSDDVAATVYLREGGGYVWWARAPFWGPAAAAHGSAISAALAREAADAWLADYCAAVGRVVAALYVGRGSAGGGTTGSRCTPRPS